MNIPTGDQCNNREKVYEDNDKIGYACWYPQMGGYSGKCIALFDREWKLLGGGAAQGGCIDVLVWHDGEFPFDGEGGNQTRELHHCVPAQFIEFGEFLKEINDRNCTDEL